MGIVCVSSKTITLKMQFTAALFPVCCYHCPSQQEIPFSLLKLPAEISKDTGGLLKHLYFFQMPSGGKLESTISPLLPLLLKAGPITVYLLEMQHLLGLLSGDFKVEFILTLASTISVCSQIRATVVCCLVRFRDFSISPLLCVRTRLSFTSLQSTPGCHTPDLWPKIFSSKITLYPPYSVTSSQNSQHSDSINKSLITLCFKRKNQTSWDSISKGSTQQIM